MLFAQKKELIKNVALSMNANALIQKWIAPTVRNKADPDKILPRSAILKNVVATLFQT